MSYNIKELVKDKTASFIYFKNNELWYSVDGPNFEFPVPISDVGDAKFLVEDKAIFFMRWIRQHINLIETAKQKN